MNKLVKKKKRGFKTKKEAINWENNFKNNMSGNADILFSNLHKNYIEDMKRRCKFSTIKLKESIFKNNIEYFFSEYKINDISPLIIRKWQNEQIDKNYKQTYLRTINKELVAIFNFATKFYKLNSNPCTTAGNIGNKKTEDEFKIWTPEEFKLFLSFIKDYRVKVVFQTLFFTGMRIGELLGLYYEDLDLENKIIKITKTNYDGVIGKTKTKGSNRNIQLSKNLYEILLEYSSKLYNPQNKEILFPISRTLLNYYIRTYSVQAGVERIRIHDLRHSHASYLISQNVNIVAVSKRLGHSSIQTTLDTYTHLLHETNDKLLEVLDNIEI